MAQKPQARAAMAALLGILALLLLWPTHPHQRPRAWLDLIAPLAPGELIGGNYRLSPPRRGDEHDIVLLARRLDGEAVVELHVVPLGQWQGVNETASFGVAFELPRSSAPRDDLIRVTHALTTAIAANDPGGLGPVTSIPLTRATPPPKLALALRKGTGLVGAAAALCLVAAALAIASLGRGALWLGLVTFAAGLALRVAHLDLPFLWDQDVQRIQIGAASLGEILTGAGLNDRRPPLLFIVLHFTQVFGQAEWLARLPAALAGALLAPAILWLTQRAVGRISALSAIAATLAALSPILIQRSREVSELTIVGLLLVVLAGETVRATRKGTGHRAALVALAAVYALTLWSYYLAIAGVVACVGVVVISMGLDRKRLLASGVGVVVGLPRTVLGARAYLADLSSRAAARANTGVAWGDRTIAEVVSAQSQLLVEAVGIGILLVAAASFAWALAKRQHLVTVTFAMAFGILLTVAALTPFVRIQPYYVVVVIPLLLLGISAVELEGRGSLVACAMTAGAAVWFLCGAAPTIASSYVHEDGAFMAGFAKEIRREHRARVTTVAHYDATLLSYYLARAEGVTLRSDRLRWSDGELRVDGLEETIVTLVRTHAHNDNPDQAALTRLRKEAESGPVMLVTRDEIRLPQFDRFAARCELRQNGAVARLLVCRQSDLHPMVPPKKGGGEGGSAR